MSGLSSQNSSKHYFKCNRQKVLYCYNLIPFFQTSSWLVQINHKCKEDYRNSERSTNSLQKRQPQKIQARQDSNPFPSIWGNVAVVELLAVDLI